MYFKLFPNCVITKGYEKSIIVDLQRFSYTIIENELVALLIHLKSICIESFQKNNEKEIFELFINLLYDLKVKELGFFTNIPNQFPELKLEWDAPSEITNAVIELNNKNCNILPKILIQLNLLRCRDIQIRFDDKLDLIKFSNFLNVIENSQIKNIEIICKYNSELRQKDLLIFLNNNYRIVKMLLFSSPENKKISHLFYTTLNLAELTFCGETSKDTFTPNISFYTESNNFNSCLNRKISINAAGDIKNCLFCSESYGNIQEINLKEAIEKSGFRGSWTITKDQIDVCMDCEFRYICTDCRCFIKNEEDIYSQPSKCNYNPYIAKWRDEDSYMTVEQWRKENPNWEKNAKRHPLVNKPQSVE